MSWHNLLDSPGFRHPVLSGVQAAAPSIAHFFILRVLLLGAKLLAINLIS